MPGARNFPGKTGTFLSGSKKRIEKQSDPALMGLEMSDVSFVRLSSRSVLLIANKLTSEF